MVSVLMLRNCNACILICIACGMRQHACLRLDPPMPKCASRPCSVHHTSLLLLPLLLQ